MDVDVCRVCEERNTRGRERVRERRERESTAAREAAKTVKIGRKMGRGEGPSPHSFFYLVRTDGTGAETRIESAALASFFEGVRGVRYKPVDCVIAA